MKKSYLLIISILFLSMNMAGQNQLISKSYICEDAQIAFQFTKSNATELIVELVGESSIIEHGNNAYVFVLRDYAMTIVEEGKGVQITYNLSRFYYLEGFPPMPPGMEEYPVRQDFLYVLKYSLDTNAFILQQKVCTNEP